MNLKTKIDPYFTYCIFLRVGKGVFPRQYTERVSGRIIILLSWPVPNRNVFDVLFIRELMHSCNSSYALARLESFDRCSLVVCRHPFTLDRIPQKRIYLYIYIFRVYYTSHIRVLNTYIYTESTAYAREAIEM